MAFSIYTIWKFSNLKYFLKLLSFWWSSKNIWTYLLLCAWTKAGKLRTFSFKKNCDNFWRFILSPCFYIWDKIAQKWLLEKGGFSKNKIGKNSGVLYFLPTSISDTRLPRSVCLKKVFSFASNGDSTARSLKGLNGKGKCLNLPEH